VSDDRPGDPKAVRHLRPQMGQAPPTPLTPFGDMTEEEIQQALSAPAGRVWTIPGDDEAAIVHEMTEKLQHLRRPFPPERIEKKPQPMWKDAWKDKRGSRCDVCHGYHVLENCIHLDYVGHANTTERLLEADPFWDWEPMAYTEAGTPYFSDGGLWIKLTVCGVTRIGFGDGKNPKEIIGDAIRNAAMRFGVALDLWAKVDLHEGVNRGDGEAPRSQRRDAGDRVSDSARQGGHRAGRQRGNTPANVAADPPPPNQDALDSLAEVCDSEGIDRRWAADRFESDYGIHIKQGSTDQILDFAAELLAAASGGPDISGDTDASGGPGADDGADGGGGAEAGVEDRRAENDVDPAAGEDAGGGVSDAGDGDSAGAVGHGGAKPAEPVVSDDPTDTSDVEPKPGDLF
jgi:hypothetical protein